MGLVHHVIAWIFKFLNLVDRLLQLFGIKICRVTRETILKDLPVEVYDEISQPDIKFLFEKFVKGMEQEQELTLFGRITVLRMSRDDLEKRLLLKKTLQEIPDILQVKIQRPVFIVGVPRTGTTFLHWFLSLDKQFRTPKLWEFLEPCPPGKVEDCTKDPRYKRAAFNIDVRKAFLSREMYAAHQTEVDQPEECLLLMLQSFYNGFLRFPFDCLDEYSRTIDNLGSCDTMKHVYRHYKKNLQVLAYGQDMEKKSFLLKAPNHLLHIESLLEVFPDAQLIFTHRPISQVLPSHISLTKFMIEQYGGTPDIKFQKRVIAAIKAWLLSAVRVMQKLDQTGTRNPMYSLAYKDLTTDALGEVRKIYDYFGMTMTPDTESAMRHYLENDPKKKKYGSHKYTMEQFGLTKEYLKHEFKEYVDFMRKKGISEDEIL